ncbi:hypothetical protein JMJ58_15055 [Haloterrigena salifodinae]|uniref:DUF8118 domain-containing protein n=1 Tax=Haloterrigena salifodinae TaxID=2675099 RepID=A0A8T8E666_9EURY|nr:hypothetical protein [Haloterrigena salifodinae]QRV17375.1 hypothetical protein JMJ58_15055 [Haloterrigena salifodinae]
MNANNADPNESIDLDDRDARALTEHITVVPTYDGSGDAEGVSPTTTCRIDTETLEGDCPDAKYNCADGRCKHVRRYEFASGRRLVPEWIDDSAITQPFGEFVDDATADLEPTAGESSSGRAIATDGGVTVREAADGAEILKDDDVDPWKGPFAEYDKYGQLTGAKYYRCRGCGREVHTDVDREHVSHRDGCRFGEDESEDSGRIEPTRHEPADFGGGETTGVQDL